MSKSRKNQKSKKNQRKPWISWNTGLIMMAVVSASLALWVGWQVAASGGNLGKGILWGLIFGGSTWLVFIGMNFFHSLFNKKK